MTNEYEAWSKKEVQNEHLECVQLSNLPITYHLKLVLMRKRLMYNEESLYKEVGQMAMTPFTLQCQLVALKLL